MTSADRHARSPRRRASLVLPGSSSTGPAGRTSRNAPGARPADVEPALAANVREPLVGTVEQGWEESVRPSESDAGDTGDPLDADALAGWTAVVARIAEGGPSE